MYERLPDLFDLEEAQRLHPASYSDSMNTVLIQEMERYNVLLREMRSSLTMLERAVQGLIVMTPDLEVRFGIVSKSDFFFFFFFFVKNKRKNSLIVTKEFNDCNTFLNK